MASIKQWKIRRKMRVGSERMEVQSKWYLWLLILPALCLIWGSNSYLRPELVEKVERLIYDHHLVQLEAPQVSPEIVLVMAGEDSLARLGRWPWPRSVHAGLLENLDLAHTVALDILFPESGQPDEDLALVYAAKRVKNLVLAMHLVSPMTDGEPNVVLPFSMLNRVAKSIGYTNMDTDTDGLVRYCKLYRECNGRKIPSFPLAAAGAIRGQPIPFHITPKGDILNSMDKVNIPADGDGKIWINHGQANAKVYEYWQVLTGDVPRETFKDKVVLIGVSASGIEDYFKIPSRYGGREITGAQLNCNIINSILSGERPHRVPPLFDGLLTMVMVLTGAVLTRMHRPTKNMLALAVLILLCYFVHQHLFVSRNIFTALFLPMCGLLTSFSIFLFFKLKFIHHETAIKTFSISSINGLLHASGEAINTYDDYLLSIWDSVQKDTGIHLLSPQTTWEKVGALDLIEPDASGVDGQDNVILAEDGKGPYRFLAMIPVPSEHPDDAQAFTLLGWKKRLTQSHIQAIVAVVLSTSWYFERLKQANEQKQLLLDTIHAISMAIDAKDPVTGGHSNRVSNLAVKIAAYLNIDKKGCDDIYLGGLIHDIGKIGVPDSILSKKGKLTEVEFDTIRQHPSVGKKIMASVKLPEVTSQAMYQHHERYDGTGYPLGLKGEQINLAGRIIAVADVFDALISDRPYRKALSIEKAIAYMKENAGKAFDAEVIYALIAILANEGVPASDCAPLARAS